MAVTDEMKIRAWDSFIREYKGNHVTEGMICRAVEAAFSLPVSNTGENAGPVNLSLEKQVEFWKGYAFEAIAAPEAAADLLQTRLAEAEARIAELEASIRNEQYQRSKVQDRHDYQAKQVEFWRDGARKEAARAETAEALLEEAWRALAPFIRLADNVFSDGKNATVADEVTLWCFNDTDITFGDLRRARATHDRIGK